MTNEPLADIAKELQAEGVVEDLLVEYNLAIIDTLSKGSPLTEAQRQYNEHGTVADVDDGEGRTINH